MSKVNCSNISSQNYDSNGTYIVSELEQLRRFIVLGTTGGTYYHSEPDLTLYNAKAIIKLIGSSGPLVVNEIVDFSVNNRAPKKDPALFALALCVVFGSDATRKLAYKAVEKVCEIPTHLFSFIDYCEKLGEEANKGTGWGRARKRTIASWYNSKSTKDLIYHTTKYKQRGGWSNRDILRLAHVKPVDRDHDLIYKYITSGELQFDAEEVSDTEAFDRLVACDEVMRAESVEQVCELITKFNLVREHIPTEWLKEPQVWEALLPKMPLNALVRNLGRLSNLGLLEKNSACTMSALDKLADTIAIKKAKVHPFNVLVAHTMYSKGGEGGLGKLRWKPNSQITSALDDLYYSSFDYVEPANKRFMLAIDVSGSMTWTKIAGTDVMMCSEGAAAMGMTIARTEPESHIVAFSGNLSKLPIDRKSSLKEAFQAVRSQVFGGTDCSLPMTYALKNKLDIDCFVVITDNENNYSKSPSESLREYRSQMGIDARLIVVSMAGSYRTIADPNDKGMLDISGFDSAGPRILRDFAAGEI